MKRIAPQSRAGGQSRTPAISCRTPHTCAGAVQSFLPNADGAYEEVAASRTRRNLRPLSCDAALFFCWCVVALPGSGAINVSCTGFDVILTGSRAASRRCRFFDPLIVTVEALCEDAGLFRTANR